MGQRMNYNDRNEVATWAELIDLALRAAGWSVGPYNGVVVCGYPEWRFSGDNRL